MLLLNNLDDIFIINQSGKNSQKEYYGREIVAVRASFGANAC